MCSYDSCVRSPPPSCVCVSLTSLKCRFLLLLLVVPLCFSYGASKTNVPAAPSWPHLLSYGADAPEHDKAAFSGLAVRLVRSARFVCFYCYLCCSPCCEEDCDSSAVWPDAEQLLGDKSGRKVYYVAAATWQHNNGNSSSNNKHDYWEAVCHNHNSQL